MYLRRRAAAAFAVLAVLCLAFAAPGAAWAQKRGGTLVYMVPASDAPTLDGHREETFATVQPTAPFYSLLVHVDPRSKLGKDIVGDLATGWTVSPDGKTYTFPLRKGVTFHDGSPLTADDVVASLNKIVFPAEGVFSARKAHFGPVDSIKAKDDHTVVIELKYATAAFIPALAAPFNYIYKADLLAKDPHWFEKNVMGSGPFKLKEHVPGDKVTGVRNEKYYIAGQPYLDGFEAIFAPKETVQIQALRGERAHANFRGFPPTVRDDLFRALGDKVVEQSSDWNCNMFAAVNTLKKPLDDLRVRQALTLAVDRWSGSEFLSKIAIVKTPGGVVFPGHPLAPSQAQLETLLGYGRNIEASRARAKALLKEAGVPEGWKIQLNNRNTDQPYRFVGTWLVDQWRQIGVDVEQLVQPTSGWFATMRGDPPTFDLSIAFNCQSIVNPALDVSTFQSTDRSEQNYARYTNRKLDELFDAQIREPDSAKQKALLWEFQKEFSEQAYYIPVMWWNRIVVHSSKMKWWEVTPSHYLNMNLASVWLDQ